jgi:hypothetical protein
MLRVVVDSTSIVSIGYDGRKRELEVEFRESGAVYLYFEVPAEIHREFMAAESKGTYLNQVLKPRGFAYRVLSEGNL